MRKFVALFLTVFLSLFSFAFASDLSLAFLDRYESGMFNTDGGVMEIVDYSPYSGKAYAVNGQSGLLAIIGYDENGLYGEDFDVKAVIEEADASFSYGDMTSVSVSSDGSLLAVALQAEGYDENGRIALFSIAKDGSITLRSIYEAGVQPDMVVFGGYLILSANEGEPREGYDAADPKGSITVVDLSSSSVENLYFDDFDGKRDELVEKGIVIKKGALPSVDFEPEYIAVNGNLAFVTLQEANAVATVDLKNRKIVDISSLGFEDYSKTAIDIDKKDDTYAPETYDGLYGIRMADGIAAFSIDGRTYIATANEGDSREWDDYLNEVEADFGDGNLSPSSRSYDVEGKVVFFDSSDYDGLDSEYDYLFGGRSMTIYSVEDGELVFASADDAESITYSILPEYYNSSNDNATIDDRSGKKGPEPESITVGEVNGRYYAFLALERTGGVMVYDVTDPYDAEFVTYVNTRDFTSIVPGSEEYEDGELDKWVTGGDVAPEGLCFISEEESPIDAPVLLVANEVSGTVAAYLVD